MAENDPFYYWAVCKVCGKWHRGDLADQGLGVPTMRKTGKIECPERKGQFGEYTLSDWMRARESQVTTDGTFAWSAPLVLPHQTRKA